MPCAQNLQQQMQQSRDRNDHIKGCWLCCWFGYTHQSPAGDLFAVSVVGCLLGYSSCLVVWIPLFLDPSDGVFGRFDLAALCGCRTLITNYQLPNGPVKAGRRWGQRHPQGANLGSNGILNFLSKLKQWLPPAHPKSLASQCMSGQPISTYHALTS